MDFLKCMSNFPWNRFATVYETNSIGLKGIFIKMFNNIDVPLKSERVL